MLDKYIFKLIKFNSRALFARYYRGVKNKLKKRKKG
jgi:hypothetical protein